MAANNCLTKLMDFRTMAWYAAGALRNLTGGMWEKFVFDGAGTSSDKYPITKPVDFKLSDTAELRDMFDRTEMGDAYESAYTDGGPVREVIKAKQQSDMLTSMLQAMSQRYSTRVRHLAAAASKRATVAGYNADAFAQTVSRGAAV